MGPKMPCACKNPECRAHMDDKKKTHPPMIMTWGVIWAVPDHPRVLNNTGAANMVMKVKIPEAVATSPINAEYLAGDGYSIRI
mmetsp:Transcript_7775/g.27728  ORF Transcript_7775/g.27728 Transcript_7775/m.27728 type:complete len:83 (+) Transcript_7775:590-838(+)